MTTLSHEQITLAKSLIDKAGSIVITAHKSPDGDAVGSMLGLFHILKHHNKNITCILPDSLPEYLHWLPGYEQIRFFDQDESQQTSIIQQADLIFALDYNHLARTGKEMEVALRSSKADFIMIDHHQQPEGFAKVLYSDTRICSTAQMVYQFATHCGWGAHILVDAAECIYCGIMTDTGSFRFPSVTPETHHIAADLMSRGLDHAKVHRLVYDTNLIDRLKLIGFALNEKLEFLEDQATALISLSQDELNRYNYRQGDTEGLVNQALSIKGVKFAAFFREGANEVKISFRSKGSFDVNQFARKYWNGGGHMNAAGAASTDSLSEALIQFKKQVAELQKEIVHS